jgi:hypothetical protein
MERMTLGQVSRGGWSALAWMDAGGFAQGRQARAVLGVESGGALAGLGGVWRWNQQVGRWWSPRGCWSRVGDCARAGMAVGSVSVFGGFRGGVRCWVGLSSVVFRAWVGAGWGARWVGVGYSFIHHVKQPQLKVALSVSGYGGYTLVGDGCAWSSIPCTGYGLWIGGGWV